MKKYIINTICKLKLEIMSDIYYYSSVAAILTHTEIFRINITLIKSLSPLKNTIYTSCDYTHI